MRVAAIDLGTNSTRLLVADVDGGRVDEVVRRLTITRLGEGVDGRGLLQAAAIERVLDCVAGYRRELERLGADRALAIATSAVRDARNGGDLLGGLGVPARVLSGEAEAALMLRGVTSDRMLEPETLIVDIGGGSTELVLGGPDGVAVATSLQLGCVRLTERHLHGDPPAAEEVEACAADVRAHLPDLAPRTAIGVAGTVTTLAALDLGLETYDAERIDGHRLARAAVSRELDRLAGLPLADRARLPCVEPGRAAVIVGGAIVLDEILGRYGLDAIEASERDILHGAALAAAEG